MLVFIFFACFALSQGAINFETSPIDAAYAQALLNEYLQSRISPVKIENRNEVKFKYVLSPKAVSHITNTVNSLHRDLPNISNIPFTQENERVTVIGDLHGQFATLLHIVTESGDDTGGNSKLAVGPDRAGMRRRYVFVGDYINREFDSLPVLMLAYVMKCAYPDDVFLIRGNHETAGNASTNGGIQNKLAEELKQRYSKRSDAKDVLKSVTDSFMFLPIGYVIDQSILVVHAGIGPNPSKIFTIKALNGINRKVANTSGDLNAIINARPVDIRTGITSYTIDHVRQFLDRENLKCLVRGHDSPRQGIQNGPKSNGENICVTVHSSSFCCPDKDQSWNNRNAGGYIHFFNRGPNIVRFDVYLGDVTSTTPSQSVGMNSPEYIRDKNARQVEQVIVKSVPRSNASKSQLSSSQSAQSQVPNPPVSHHVRLLMGGLALVAAVLGLAGLAWYIRKRRDEEPVSINHAI